MKNVSHTKMIAGWRVAVPAEMCHQYGIKPGSTLVVEPVESGIMLRPLDCVIKEVQSFFSDIAPGVSFSDELSRDRLTEARGESSV